ncbi:MAG: hypothetical protein M3120_08110, partial [Pseudomonadota bacterium]|nr:hypothetical protein [Pseudomonadota bacterium]
IVPLITDKMLPETCCHIPRSPLWRGWRVEAQSAARRRKSRLNGHQCSGKARIILGDVSSRAGNLAAPRAHQPEEMRLALLAQYMLKPVNVLDE